MRQILPGVFHWTSFHEGIGEMVHSCFVEAAEPPFLIDPQVPEQGLSWFARHERPRHAYLTNRHHYRHSGRFAEAFGTKVWCHRAGLHEFTHGEEVTPFEHGATLPGGVKALEVGVLCPEETALQLPFSGGILALGDAIVRGTRGRLEFVPDELMGDDPEAVKQGLRRIFARHLRRKFMHLLLAHGAPVISDGKEALREFLHRIEHSPARAPRRSRAGYPAEPVSDRLPR